MESEAAFLRANAISCSALSSSFTASFALNNPPTQSTISFPYTVSKVIPIVKAVCQENKEETTCFQTGVADFPSAFKALNSFLALLISSARIGKLLLIAEKNTLGP